MVNILVINSGSSSLKYQLVDMSDEKVLAQGICERIGLEGSFLKWKTHNKDELSTFQSIPDHTSAIQMVIESLTHPDRGVIGSMSEIAAVGHRVVHGGEHFQSSVLINEDVLQAIRSCIELAPLHNPPNIIGIEACQKLLPNIPMVAVFDTAFHQTMPPHSYLYAIPYEMYEKYGIRKYGFHGTSHKYVAHRASEIIGKPIHELKIISCHLGNGASICAIDRGNSIDTTMGFTPLEGLVMGTRSGSVDPAIITFLMEKEKMDAQEIGDFLNKKSGLLGISGVSSDFRDIEKAVSQNNERAELALEIFCYRVKKYIGEYIAALNGLDVLIFTAGIGENDWQVREKALQNLDYVGIKIDGQKNKDTVEKGLEHKEIEITAEGAKVRTFVIHTNEELMIAKDTLQVISSGAS